MAEFRASAIDIDLEPKPGMWMTGYGARTKPAEGTHDPIYAHILMMFDGKNSFVLVSCDVLGFGAADVCDIRNRVSRASNIPAQCIWIAGTHTHSGPATQHLRGVMGRADNIWLEEVKAKIVDAICRLPDQLENATFSYGKTTFAEFAYNRQDESHSIDGEMIVFEIRSFSGKCIATVVNYAMHPVLLGPSNLQFSGDYPGELCRHLVQIQGGVALFLQGASGDIDPAMNRGELWGKGTFGDCKRVGCVLANEAAKVLRGAERTNSVEINTISKTIDVPLEAPMSAKEIEDLIYSYETYGVSTEGIGEVIPEIWQEAMLQWAYELKHAIDADSVPRFLSSEVFAAGINEFHLVGVPFEPYSDIASVVKRNMFPSITAVVGYSNGLYGYMPVQWAREQGGYASTAYRWFEGMLTAFTPDAGKRLVSGMLNSLSSVSQICAVGS